MSDASDSSGQSWNPRLYDDRHAFVWRHGASLVELLAPKPGERVLDIGCGTGHLTAQVASVGATVLGIDSSPDMIAEARRAHPDLRFEVADARTLAFAAAYDAVFSNAALHWVKEADAVAAGVARALKPGGRFVAEFGGRGNVRVIEAALAGGLAAVGAEPAASPWYFPSVAEYAGVLERAGLEVTFALLFDRPTPLEGGETGLRAWAEMFGGYYLTRVPAAGREEYLQCVEDAVRPALFRDGGWVADYRRLRVTARRVA